MAIRFSLKKMFGGYAPVFGFVLLVLVLLLVHAGSLLNFGFPVLATVLAFYLFMTQRNIYVAFVWWCWLFSPLARRLVDYQTSFHAVSPIILTPLAVTSIAFFPLLRNPRFILRRSLSPFFFMLLVYLYALIVGVLENGIAPAVYDFANSVVPLAFALFLMSDYKWFAENRKSFLLSVTTGLLLISIYGLYQFYRMPPWDAYWLSASKFTSAGAGIALQVRLFGPLNSPGPYGTVLMISLVFILVTKGWLRIVAGGFGFPAFGLSLVRSSWGGWALSALIIMLFSKGRTRVRMIVLGFVLALVAFPLVTVGPVANIISKRFASFSNIQQDGSYKERQHLYENFTLDAFSAPLGIGFGGNGLSTKLGSNAVQGFDSGVLQIPFQFGWVFGGLFVWCLVALGIKAMTAATKGADSISIAGWAIYLATVLQNIGAPTWSGVLGLGMWIGVALALGPIKATNPAKLRLGGTPVNRFVPGIVRGS